MFNTSFYRSDKAILLLRIFVLSNKRREMKKRNLSKSNSPSSVNHGNSFIGKELILVSYILLKQLFKMFLLTQLQSTIRKYTGNIASLLIACRRLKLLFF